MNRRDRCALAAVAALALASGCATNLSLEKKTSDDCLVLVPCKVDNPLGLLDARIFHLSLSDREDKIEVDKGTKDFFAIKVRGSGVRIVNLSSDVDSTLATGNSSEDVQDIALPYAPGDVVCADHAFVRRLRKGTSGGAGGGEMIMEASGFLDATDEMKDSALKAFHAMEGKYKSWVSSP